MSRVAVFQVGPARKLKLVVYSHVCSSARPIPLPLRVCMHMSALFRTRKTAQPPVVARMFSAWPLQRLAPTVRRHAHIHVHGHVHRHVYMCRQVYAHVHRQMWPRGSSSLLRLGLYFRTRRKSSIIAYHKLPTRCMELRL